MMDQDIKDALIGWLSFAFLITLGLLLILFFTYWGYCRCELVEAVTKLPVRCLSYDEMVKVKAIQDKVEAEMNEQPGLWR